MCSQSALLAVFGMPGWAELLIVAFLGLLLFGKRLPDVARSLGQSIIEFKKGMQGMKQDIEKAGAQTPDTQTPESEADRRKRLSLPEGSSSSSSPSTPSKQPVETGD